MKWLTVQVLIILTALTIFAIVPFESGHTEDEASSISGIKIPAGYREWRLISVAHEEGNLNDLRAILGNDVAVQAFREGRLPFPDGTNIARLSWDYVPLEESSKAFGRLQSFVAGPPATRASLFLRKLAQHNVDLFVHWQSFGTAAAVVGTIASVAPTLGPVIGGWITDTINWHWLF
jgi:hypothetical protein